MWAGLGGAFDSGERFLRPDSLCIVGNKLTVILGWWMN